MSPANPSQLPSGNNIGFTASYSADSSYPALGVDRSGEWVMIVLGINTNSDIGDVYAAVANGSVGLHVSSIGVGSYSNGFVSTPIPAAAWLLGTGLIGLVAVRRYRK